MIKIGKLKLLQIALLSSLFCGVFAATVFAQEVETGTKNQPKIAQAGDPMFIDIDLPRHQVYLGETIRVQYDVYVAQARGLVNYDAVEPNFTGWTVLELPPPKASMVSLNGERFTKEPFAVYYLNATQLGQLPLPRLTVEMPFAKPPIWISNAERIVEVLAPTRPSPKSFNHHNIGAIELKLKLNATKTIRVGDVLNLELNVIANAPSANIVFELANNEQIKEVFRIQKPYQIASKTEIVDDKYISQTSYRIRVSPLKEGKWVLPQFQLTAFNPSLQIYEDLRSEAMTVEVQAAKLNSTDVLDGQMSKTPQRQLRSLKLQSKNPQKVPSLAFGLIPLLLIAFGFVFGCFYDRSKKQRSWYERKQRFKQFKLDFMAAQDAESQLTKLQEHLAVIFELPPSSPTALMLKQIQDADIPKHDIDTLTETITELSQSTYSDKRPIKRKEAETIVFILKQMMQSKEQDKCI